MKGGIAKRLLVCELIAISCLAGSVSAQPVAVTAAATPQSQFLSALQARPQDNVFVGSVGCAACHERPSTGYESAGVTKRIKLNEYAIWKGRLDKHARAYESLSNARSQRMAALLGDVTDAKTGCVQCHTSNSEHKWGDSCLTEADGKQKNLCLEQGVGCESCHGPSRGWDFDHRNFETWSKKSLDERTGQGWIDVRSPVTRAEVCGSCHLGSPTLNRRITHEMYAAGHPPLSGFEIESFADKMPRHWRYEKEKSGRESYQRTTNVLIGSVVAVRMSIELAAADASAPTERWPELARMDCYDCHHDLANSGWRQEVSESRPPGRPRLAAGSLPIVAIAADVAYGSEGKENFGQLVAQLQAPFELSAFGDPDKIVQGAPAIAAWCRTLERNLQQRPMSAATARQVFERLGLSAVDQPVDYDTARQLFGSWTVVYDELMANKAISLTTDANTKLQRWKSRLESLDPFLLEPKARIIGPAEVDRERSVEMLLPTMFGNRERYRPQSFSELMADLRRLTSLAAPSTPAGGSRP